MLSGIGLELELGLILLQPAKPSVKVMVSDRARVEGFNRDSHGLDRALIINILIFYVYVLLIIHFASKVCVKKSLSSIQRLVFNHRTFARKIFDSKGFMLSHLVQNR